VQSGAEEIRKLDRICWVEGSATSLRLLAAELGLKPVPGHLVVLLPRFVEDELLRKELAYSQRAEKDIGETGFEFFRSGRGFDMRVASQR
jgi:hypothetical protein